jgi:hypothetical protein
VGSCTLVVLFGYHIFSNLKALYTGRSSSSKKTSRGYLKYF